jgi:hypothetical protein
MGNLWPPYFFAGIRIKTVSKDFKDITVHLKFAWYNRNYVGTQFGGSIYAMTDPFYMMMIMNNLGRDYIVWDKAAQIDFLKPGKSTLTAQFKIDDQILDLIRSKTAFGKKYIFDLPIPVKDKDGITIANIEKTI